MVAELLTEYRLAAKQTKEQAAAGMGVSVRTYGEYESGRRKPRFESMIKLFNHYGYQVQLIKKEMEIKL